MAEAGLSLEFADFQAEVGGFLGFGRTPGSFTAAQTAKVDAAIQRGYRDFLAPPPLGDGQPPWEWSFLQQLTSMTAWTDLGTDSGITVTGSGVGGTTVTASAAAFYPEMIGRSIVITGVGTFTVVGYTSSTVITVSGDASGAAAATFSLASTGRFRMVDTFGGVNGRITYSPDDGWQSLTKRGEEEIRRLRQSQGDTTGRPRLYALEFFTHDPTVGQRCDMYLWPLPDGDYPLNFLMRAYQGKLTTLNKYPLGGTKHCETVLAGCLAAADLQENDNVGHHAQRFALRLAASIEMDAREGPEVLGYNGEGGIDDSEPRRVGYVTVGGVLYD